MEGNQKIHCSVGSCAYNDSQERLCTLQAIKVAPINNRKTMKPDESMCASYQYENN